MGQLLKFRNRPTQQEPELELHLSDLLAEIDVELLDTLQCQCGARWRSDEIEPPQIWCVWFGSLPRRPQRS